ncbi:MAG: hypothetical protein IT260_23295 [Saprospiraceae bacterium]|nr:hypothetical protein [Saprospiraceae bacterium]
MLPTDTRDLQCRLLQHIARLCGEKNVAAILGELLSLNKSSVYNRLNGDKLLSLDELLLLAQQFQLSLDEWLLPPDGQVRFRFGALQAPVRNGREYLEDMAAHFKRFAETQHLRVWFSTSTLPFFYHLNFRELALFKLFAYARISWQLPYTESLRFDPDTFPERDLYERLMRPMLEYYTRLPSVEFWSDDLFDNTLKQIEYFAAAGQLASPKVADVLLEQLQMLCSQQYEMARQGLKWTAGSRGPAPGAGALELFYNKIAPLNITLLAESPQVKGVFTVFNDPNFMFSTDEPLYAYTLAWLHKLKEKCVRISQDGEQYRRAYFNGLQDGLKGPLGSII